MCSLLMQINGLSDLHERLSRQNGVGATAQEKDTVNKTRPPYEAAREKPAALAFMRHLYIATGLLTRLPSKLSCLVVKCGFRSQTYWLWAQFCY